MASLTRKPIFWGVSSLVSVALIVVTVYLFPKAFPLVNLNLTMDRTQALTTSNNLAQEHSWGPSAYQQAAVFHLDDDTKTFVELEAGGKQALSEMLDGDLYAPYIWKVRHFNEFNPNETEIRFRPDGKPFGFTEILSEDETGTNISATRARNVAEQQAQTKWSINLDEYKLIEESTETKPSERVDHTFVYERSKEALGEGRYRLRLVISGNKLTELTHFVQIPEAFTLRYKEMRSANNSLASAASMAMMLLYILGGCILGLFLLLRRNWVLWKQAYFWGIVIALLQALANLNQLPLYWMEYDTALSTHGFLFEILVTIFITFIRSSLIYSLSFMAAESLTRRAFGNHIQFWNLWSKNNAASLQLLGRTIGGYLLVTIDLAFVVLFYLLTTTYLGWWEPAEALINPNILATYLPWLAPVAQALVAGFWEECLFRAVPLASAALLGKKFGRKKWWLIGMLILQAIIFGAAHANYPAQPAYARLVELIIPSLIFGGIYLVYGLLPAILSHFTFDVVLMSLPLFISSASGAWVNQGIVIILSLIPLWLIIRARLKNKQWLELNKNEYNNAWQPDKLSTKVHTIKVPQTQPLITTQRIQKLLIPSALIGLTLWFFGTQFNNDAEQLNINRTDAITVARTTLKQKEIVLDESWTALNGIVGTYEADKEDDETELQHRFIWQEEGKKRYKKLIGTFLYPPCWLVRFIKFEGDTTERAEEYNVIVANNGTILRVKHILPEATPGEQLSEQKARALIHKHLEKELNTELDKFQEISAIAQQHPQRKDWTFTFHDTNVSLKSGQARIVVEVAGNEIVDSYRYIHVPEQWTRNERKEKNIASGFKSLCSITLYLLFVISMIVALIGLSRKTFKFTTFITVSLSSLILMLVSLINSWPLIIAEFNTSEPFFNQAFVALGSTTVGLLLRALNLGLLWGLITTYNAPQPKKNGQLLLSSIGLGLVLAGFFGLVHYMAPSVQPLWAQYTAFGVFIPSINVIVGFILKYINITLLFLIITQAINSYTHYWTKQKISASFMVILSGVLLSGALKIDHVPSWLMSGLVLGILLLIIYRLYIQYTIRVIPIITAIYVVAESIQQIIFNAYPGSFIGNGIALVSVIYLSSHIYKRLQ